MMSAEDYGYASYDEMIQHASHHGGGIDMDANAVEWVETELAALRQRVAELEAAQAIVTPNNCLHFRKAAEQMREAAAKKATELNWYSGKGIAGVIRALPLPECDGCNPLKPGAYQANRADSLQAWADLWEHICRRLGAVYALPNSSNFDAALFSFLTNK